MPTIFKCPKCGQTENGYSYRMRITYTMIGLWGEVPESDGGVSPTESESITKTVGCNDCGARIKIEVATGEIEE